MSEIACKLLGLKATSGVLVAAGVGAALLTVGAAPATVPLLATAALGQLAAQAGAYAINRLSAKADQREANARQALDAMSRGTTNHDVQRLIFAAIALVLRERALQESADSRTRLILETLAADVEAGSSALTDASLPPALSEAKVGQYFSKAPESIKAQPVMDVAGWRGFLEPVANAAKHPLNDADWSLVGGVLAERFAAGLYATAKTAAITDDPAWPGLLLRLFAEQRELLEGTFKLVDEANQRTKSIHGDTLDIKDDVRELKADFAKFADAGVSRFEALLNTKDRRDDARYQSLFALIQQQGKAIRAGLSSVWTLAERSHQDQQVMLAKLDSIAADVKAGHMEAKRGADAAVEARDISKRIETDIKGRIRPATSPNTVPTPSQTFIKRKNVTAKIHAALQATPEQVVVRQAVTRAMGGYGKTVAAILYADEYQQHYQGGRFFLSVESGDLITALASLITPLGLASKNDPAADAALVSHTLRAGEPSLLILDNVASKADWDTMLALKIPGTQLSLVPRGCCRVLITTRDEAINPESAIKIGRLTDAEAGEVFALFCSDRHASATDAQRFAGLPDALPSEQITREVTEWLGGLAVAIAAVAAYMKLRPHISWKDYWEGTTPAPSSAIKPLRGLKHTPVGDLPEVRPEVAAQLGLSGQPLEAHRRTLRVIDDAYDALRPLGQTTDSAEQRAIQYAALLPHDMAPAIWLEQLLEADGARTEGPLCLVLVDDPDEPLTPAQSVLQHLDRLDILLPSREQGKLVSLHRLWHARVNERSPTANPERASLWSAIATCAAERRAVVVGKDEPGKAAAIDNPHVLTNAALRWELTPLISVAVALASAGQLKEAESVAWWLPIPLQLLGRLNEAQVVLESLLADLEAAQATLGNYDFAALLTNLAVIQRKQGNFAAARARIKHAINVEEGQPQPSPADLARMYSNLSLIQKDQGDLAGARASIERTIAFEEKHFAANHPTFATSYSNLAAIQRAQAQFYVSEGEYGRAKSEFAAARTSMERAIAIRLKHFAPDHPTLAISYSNLAVIQNDQGDLRGARASIERAIAIKLKYFDTDNSNMAISYNNLAHIAVAQGNVPEAVALWRKSYPIHLKALGPDHPYTQSDAAALRRYDPSWP